MITELSRGHVRVLVGTREVTVAGELLCPPPATPNFVIYSDQLVQWDDGTAISELDKRAVLEVTRQSMADCGLTIEIE